MGIPFDIPSAIKSIGNLVDDLHTSEEEKRMLAIEERKLDLQLDTSQIEVNKVEAQHKSIFVAGWRPFIGWVGGIALAYQFIIYPLMVWLWNLLQAKGILPADITTPPVFESGQLFAIITGMLGIGGMRSYDKAKNTVTDAIWSAKDDIKKGKGVFKKLF